MTVFITNFSLDLLIHRTHIQVEAAIEEKFQSLVNGIIRANAILDLTADMNISVLTHPVENLDIQS